MTINNAMTRSYHAHMYSDQGNASNHIIKPKWITKETLKTVKLKHRCFVNTNGILVLPLLSDMLKYKISVKALLNKLKKNMKDTLD